MVLLVLAALWAVVLVPPVLRSRSQRSADSIGDFAHRLGVLRRTNGSGGSSVVAGPRRPPEVHAFGGSPTGAVFGAAAVARRREAARRRQNVLAALVVGAAVSLVGAVLGGDPSLWVLHLLVDAALVAYGGLLAYYRRVAMSAPRAPVHELHRHAPAGDEPALVLRRVADL